VVSRRQAALTEGWIALRVQNPTENLLLRQRLC
jgi:hypothetical protein